MDFAVQCSPDHPCVNSNPDWFRKRPDGTIKLRRESPKKYQDIVPINFRNRRRDGLYQSAARCRVVLG